MSTGKQSTTDQSNATTEMDQGNANRSTDTDKTCVVCFKIVDIFSIGECDHPVCYECSTRMRVLCKQNECPICRRLNQKVVFTSEILQYRELDKQNRSGLYDKSFRISFTGQRAQNAFRRLLEHTCNKCQIQPFETNTELKEHLRKVHELFYCDICFEHLKIFSFERRAYTREQLATHRRKGDPDNKSHRGHPLCEYCEERYLDRDELFRHLRREHYFCHFCDADGSNQFYADHQSLKEHFVGEHFLCEEGDCKENIFSAVFRSEIDLKAHKATVHGQNSKQARTIDFQFNLAPRARGQQQQQQHQQQHQQHMLQQQQLLQQQQNDIDANNQFDSRLSPTVNNSTMRIDAQNEQEFPSLGNAPVVIRPPIAMIMGNSTRALAKTKENFPALGGGNAAPRDLFKPLPSTSGLNASAVLKTKAIVPAAKPTKSVLAAKKTPSNTAKDFPALPITSKTKKAIDTDFIEVPMSYNPVNVSAKHRQLVQTYESVSSNPANNQKMKIIKQNSAQPVQSKPNGNVAALNSIDSFPALGGASFSAAAPKWLNGNATTAKKQTQISKKLKVAPAPILPTSRSDETKKSKSNEKPKEKSANDKNTVVADSVNEKPAQIKSKATNAELANKKSKENNDKKKANAPTKSDTNQSKTNQSNHLPNGSASVTDELANSYSSVANFTMPPPGFPAKEVKKTKVPPGFELNVLNENKQISQYISPSNSLVRNQILVSHFMKSLKSPAVDEFRNISKLFRSGLCHASAYYEHCQIVLGDRFENIFPELLVLLPDISKQQELHDVYVNKHNGAGSSELNKFVRTCERCEQILKRTDFGEHEKFHNEIAADNKLNKNFPKLSIKK